MTLFSRCAVRYDCICSLTNSQCMFLCIYPNDPNVHTKKRVNRIRIRLSILTSTCGFAVAATAACFLCSFVYLFLSVLCVRWYCWRFAFGCVTTIVVTISEKEKRDTSTLIRNPNERQQKKKEQRCCISLYQCNCESCERVANRTRQVVNRKGNHYNQLSHTIIKKKKTLAHAYNRAHTLYIH